MMTRAIVPLDQLDRRAPEAGRIRLGVKTERAMKSIDTFRFTSRHREAIDKLAELYGGTVKPWSGGRDEGDQWEVITTSNRIEVLAQPGGLSTWYELWSGGGCQRRCNGVVCEVPGPEEMMETACICIAKDKAECKPYTRLQVVLPELDFYGVWRLETKGWNAAHELPGMFDMVVGLAEVGRMVRAHLNLERRSQIQNGKTKHFVVPTISVAATPNELLTGGGVARPQLGGAAPSAAPQLGAGSTPPVDDTDEPMTPAIEDLPRDPEPVDEVAEADEIVDAVVVMDESVERELEEQVRTIADDHGHDPDVVVATLWHATNQDETKIRSFIKKSTEGKKLVFTSTGNLRWRTSE